MEIATATLTVDTSSTNSAHRRDEDATRRNGDTCHEEQKKHDEKILLPSDEIVSFAVSRVKKLIMAMVNGYAYEICIGNNNTEDALSAANALDLSLKIPNLKNTLLSPDLLEQWNKEARDRLLTVIRDNFDKFRASI